MGNGIDPTTAYDANGNILRMQQWGLKLNSSSQIDDLSYQYLPNSNKLKSVTEATLGTTDNKLGDFTDKNTSNDDYNYDVNGNLNLDKNKNISAITYNYLNLPQTITVTGNGTITYTYDAAGNKLQKQVAETGQPTKTTLYLGGIYENDQLQFIGHEEGRIRFKPAVGETPAGFEYDYFIKDHLGNPAKAGQVVRMVLTEEQKIDKYPTATLETAKLPTEKNYYAIQDAQVVNKSEATGITDYINDNGIGNNPSDPAFETTNSAKLYKLNSGTAKTGLGMTLKVMAGDKIDVFGKSYYFQNTGGTSGNSPVPVLDILDGFLNSPASVGSVHGIGGSDINVPAGVTGINSMLRLILAVKCYQ